MFDLLNLVRQHKDANAEDSYLYWQAIEKVEDVDANEYKLEGLNAQDENYLWPIKIKQRIYVNLNVIDL